MRPRFIAALTRPGPWMFGLFWALESLSRALIAAVISVAAYDLGGSNVVMTFMFVIVGIFSVGSALAIPTVIHRLRPLRTYRLGALLVAASPAVMAFGNLGTFFIGMFGRVFATNCMQVGLSLFIMGYIRKRDMSQSEPIRMLMAALPWAIGPTLGIWLYNNMGRGSPFILSAVVALILILYAFLVNIDETPVLKAVPPKPANPLTYVPRFARQPRLRLAYLLIFGRENWWWMIYLYVPVYAEYNNMEIAVLRADLPVGGLALSFCSALAILAPLWGRVMRRIGMRRCVIIGFCASAVMVALAGLMIDDPWIAIGLILVSAIPLSATDATGNVPFLRAVKSRERTEMAMVYGTYRDMVGLVVPSVFTLLLLVFQLDAVFFATAIALLVYASYARHLPKAM